MSDSKSNPKNYTVRSLIEALEKIERAQGDVPVLLEDSRSNVLDITRIEVSKSGYCWVVLS